MPDGARRRPTPWKSLRDASLRRQLTALILAVLIPAVLLQAGMVPALMMRRFGDLETRQLQALSGMVERAYRQEDTRLRSYTQNFASWSETFQFAQNHNPDYLTVNLVPSTFEGGNVELWGIEDLQGTLRSAARYRNRTIEVDEGARGLVRQALRQIPLPRSGAFSGVARIGQTYYLLAVKPVTRDDGSGLAGRMLLGRELTPATLHQMLALSPGTDLTLTPASQINGTPAPEPERLVAALPLDAPDGTPAAVLRVSQPRAVTAAGRQTAVQITLITLLCSTAMLGAVTVFMRARILRVIEAYDHDLRRMASTPDTRLQVFAPDELGRLARTINDLRDQHVHQYNEIRRLHQHDALTGLPNRAGLARPDEPRCSAAVVVQVSSLENLSGLYGALITDQLMVQLAVRLRMNAPGAQALRIRTDTFALLGHASLEDLRPAVTAAALPYRTTTHEVRLRLHVGQVETPTSQAAEYLLECAELALHEAHESGEAVRTYTQDTRHRLERARILTDSLRQTGEHGFTLQYQPVINLRSQTVAAFEALLRWEHPQLGPVSPAEFVPLAERSGRISALGQWVIRQAALDLLRSRHPARVNVNVSPVQLLSPSFAEDTLATVRETGLPAHRLTLEVTESAVLEDLTLATAHLNALRGAGIRIALDDFGTGYSSLSLLSRLPIDVIKLDRAFLAEALTQPAAQTVLTQVVALAAQLGLPVVAEGIEDHGTLTLLHGLNVTYGQGYLLGRPADFSASLGLHAPVPERPGTASAD